LYITVCDGATRHIEVQNASSLPGKIPRVTPVYALGHRNMYGIAFDKNTWLGGLGMVTENVDVLYDEINLIQKSGNYGFPTFQSPNISPELSNSSGSIAPVQSCDTEREIELQSFPFEGIISIAQSPMGDIYFGGYSIFRIKPISIQPTQQVLFHLK
jgi:hypothetical protein